MKSYEEYPYELTTIIPKGSSIGSKKKDTIRGTNDVKNW